MGGQGSGRRSGWGRAKVEAFWSIDVNGLHRAGCLRPGYQGRWRQRQGGETTAEIDFRAEQNRFHLDYHFRANGGDWQRLVEAIEIVRVPCRFGGERPYFICQGGLNGKACGRRVGKLYRANRRFLCRHCCQITYASQCEDRLMRLRRKARKALRHLDGDTSDWISVQRPKGMWHRTFDRLQRQAFELEMDAEALFDARLAHIEHQSRKGAKGRRRKNDRNHA